MSVTEGLRHIAAHKFDFLPSDLRACATPIRTR
jgi:hypothetical protein